ncbi:MAG: phenylalanine--tRNA ligase subunit beta [Oscillospiraceae bacterium]|nr:phenylalanine--tRNA ligase subunit beta [Oscillospiraceae bacterium]
MDLSLRWLGDYVDVARLDVKTFCDGMTMSGSKVEGWHKEGDEITNTVVGRITKIDKHPDADKLQVCQVDIGKEQEIQIVTAATNVVVGALVPVALDNSTLCGGIKIKKGKLRGEVSEGMFCSVAELGLTVNDFPYAIADGILLIEEDCKPGDDIHDALHLNDTVVEFEITSNRPDCLSVLGLAREAAATFSLPLSQPELPEVPKKQGVLGELVDKVTGKKNDEEEKETIENFLSVEIKNNTDCFRYTAAMVKNVKIGPSPRWMRERLRASGVRPINNIVDITNYVCLEYGQPMHAFDYKLVKGGKIVVRSAKEGESITTLEGVEHKLSPEMLVIADAVEPTAVAGVMGGEYSGILEDTHTVVFESASFAGAQVRKTARKLGLRTESSARFEKGLPEENAILALMRACQLVELLGIGDVVEGVIDVWPKPKKAAKVPFDADKVNEFIGFNVPEKVQVEILKSLGFEFSLGKAVVPYFRTDIQAPCDLAEEVARIHGYDRIPSTLMRGTGVSIPTQRQKLTSEISAKLAALGLYEVLTYSFVSPKYYDKIHLPEDSPLRDSVVIKNPLGEDTSVMRTTALPSMLEVVARNISNRNEKGRFFEIATEYHKVAGEKLPNEPQVITLGAYGARENFFTLKGVVEELLAEVRCGEVRYVANSENPTYHPGRCADLYLGEEYLGTIGQIHPLVAAEYGVDAPIYAGRISLELLLAHPAPVIIAKPLPRFPKVTRDLALVCDKDLPVYEIEKVIREKGGNLLQSVRLFDLYEGDQVPAGKKSVAYQLVLQPEDHTLTDEESEAVIHRVLKYLAQKDVVLRS